MNLSNDMRHGNSKRGNEKYFVIIIQQFKKYINYKNVDILKIKQIINAHPSTKK